MKRWMVPIMILSAALLTLAGCGAGGAAESSGIGAQDARDIGSPEPGTALPATDDPDTPVSSDPNAPLSDGGVSGSEGGAGGASPDSKGDADGGGVSGSEGGGDDPHPPAATADEASAAVIGALASRDLESLKAYAHPARGILFSPYASIDTETALVFRADELPPFDDGTVRTWGAYDGSGEPIELTFAEYFDRFVYDQDFASAEQVGKNEIIGQGNAIVNIADVFPGGATVDYHFGGFDPQFEGMDWRSLILVLEEHEGAWYVSAVVHSQWTI